MGWIRLRQRVLGGRFKMLKGLLYGLLLLVFGVHPLMAQTWSEWFRQKKTQQRYLIEQIAALRGYAEMVQNGYRLASSGLGVVSDLAKGEFSLHHAFISGLKQVNPGIRNSEKVAEVVEMQLAISSGFRDLDRDGRLGFSDRQYVEQVRENLWQWCLDDLEELLLVITAGRLEMDDRQRLERLDKVYFSMREHLAFAQRFQQTVWGIINSGKDEQRSIGSLWKLHGIR
ncbi:hypothetical protein [Pedobacter ureilyticus]|uniref:TerB family tellurite resistance protein n=1 Tax=Pedobacter ureilyticus TaxID=1393051 RepID=A0ABW9J8A0_9SPHI